MMVRSTCLALAIGLASAVAAPAGAQEQRDPRLVRVELWLKALIDHEPGAKDEAAVRVASWSAGEIGTLWIDANVIVQLMRDPRKSSFSFKSEEQRNPQPVRYTTVQLRRLKALACAAAGILTHPACLEVRAATSLDSELLRLSDLVAAGRQRGDDNFVFRRGALLHADIEMLLPQPVEPMGPNGLPGPQRIHIQTTDGVAMNMGQLAPHWELARMLLDHVRPERVAHPAPGLDDMVRLWYRATAAWMQAHEQHDTDHLDRARAIFPKDADILFLSACQHETYAGAPIQTATRGMPAVTGMRFDVLSERPELQQAESLFRRALAARPAMAEARLRYGRVLFLLERYPEAVAELRQALTSIEEVEQRYYAELFLGAAEAARRNFDSARDAYRRAAQLYPTAQSPRMGLSELARRLGDRGVALREMQPIFQQPADDAERDDPWWRYYVVQARNADDLLEALRQPFRNVP